MAILAWMALALGANGCGGLLFVNEGETSPPTACETWRDCGVGEMCVGRVCTEAALCSVVKAAGVYCPEGRTCCGGVCLDTGGGDCDGEGGDWCPQCSEGEGCDKGDCVPITAETECGRDNSNGVCPDGEVCVAGDPDASCVPIIGPCGCENKEQTCENGQCVDIPPEAACSTSNLKGKCPDGELCVIGVCQSGTNACSPEKPLGLCESGSACFNGYCIPIEENPCSQTNGTGLCSAGQVCVPPCAPAACSSGFPSGYCDEDYLCINGTCKQLPCLPGHVGGSCLDTMFCSHAGHCLNVGECAHPEDCDGSVCSCESEGKRTCIHSDSCLTDCDCLVYQEHGAGVHLCSDSQVCVRSYDCQNDSECATATEICAESGTCVPKGSCEVSADCRAGGIFCATLGDCDNLHVFPETCLCMNVGNCRGDDDCLEVDPNGGYFCDDEGRCIEKGTCTTDAHCPPGYQCRVDNICVLGPDLCDANDFTSGCSGNDVLCCEHDTCCAIEGEICSVMGTCIEVGECLDDNDCLGGAAEGIFDCVDYTCMPTLDCADCVDEIEKCSAATQSCIAKKNCAGDRDCAEGEICHATFTCVPALNCGNGDLAAGALVKPNVMVVLDRSGSMEKCDLAGSSDSRWNEALGAIDTLTGNFNGTVSFGLSSFPHQWCGTDSGCGEACNQYTCDAIYCVDAAGNCEPDSGAAGRVCTSNLVPGEVDLATQEFAYVAIADALSVTYPGGGTPIGPTLRKLKEDADTAGLQAPGRENVVVLITDGEANGDMGYVEGCVGAPGVCTGSGDCPTGNECASPSSGGDGSCHDIPCKVNKALDDLRGLPIAVDTFVIGFAFGTVSPRLNCHAVHGGRSICPADDPICELYGSGGEAACDASLCLWNGTACVGNDNLCSTLTAGGETACAEVSACTWTTESESCESNAAFCAAVAVGGGASCAVVGCNWDGSKCRGVCAAHHGDRNACEAARCVYDGSNCVSVDATNCSQVNAACYYNASDAASLGQALDSILGDVASCAFDLVSMPPDTSKLFAYLQYEDPGQVPVDCSNTSYQLCRHPRDRSRTQHWDFDPVRLQVEFYGDACADITTGAALPLIIYGCDSGGG